MKFANYKKISLIIMAALVLCVICDYAISSFLKAGIDNYFGLNQKPQVLLIGHSHLMLAVDKERLEKDLGIKVSKYCREGVNVFDKKKMVETFLMDNKADSLKFVLYGVDLATFTGDGLSNNSYKLFYPFMDEDKIDDYIARNSSPSDYWLHKLIRSSRFNDDAVKNSALRGWMNNWENYKSNTIDIETYKRLLSNGGERRIEMNDSLIKDFKQTIKMLTDREINVLLVNTPTLDLLNNFEPNKYRHIINWFSDFAAQNQFVEFIDFNPKYQADYKIFSDRIHLNRAGQEVITTELINILSHRL